MDNENQNNNQNVVTVNIGAEKEEKKSFKKSNVATLVFQIIFAVLCAIVLIFEIMMTSSIGQDFDNGLAEGIGRLAAIIFMIIPTVIAGIFIIPFILFMVLCKRPWIALGAYGALFICTIVCWAVLYLAPTASDASNVVQYLPLLTSLI